MSGLGKFSSHLDTSASLAPNTSLSATAVHTIEALHLSGAGGGVAESAFIYLAWQISSHVSSIHFQYYVSTTAVQRATDTVCATF